MSMQIFYARLFSNTSAQDHYLQCLAKLTNISLTQIAALKNDLTWDPWSADPA
jgi:hypothetical protein